MARMSHEDIHCANRQQKQLTKNLPIKASNMRGTVYGSVMATSYLAQNSRYTRVASVVTKCESFINFQMQGKKQKQLKFNAVPLWSQEGSGSPNCSVSCDTISHLRNFDPKSMPFTTALLSFETSAAIPDDNRMNISTEVNNSAHNMAVKSTHRSIMPQ